MRLVRQGNAPYTGRRVAIDANRDESFARSVIWRLVAEVRAVEIGVATAGHHQGNVAALFHDPAMIANTCSTRAVQS